MKCFCSKKTQRLLLFNYRFFDIVAAVDASSKFIGGDLSMAVDGKFLLLFMFILVSTHRKATVNITQPLRTTI